MRRRAALVVPILLIAAPAVAQTMPERMASAIKWIEANSDYRKIPPPRTWMEVTPAQMQAMANRGGSRSAVGMYYCSSQSVALLSHMPGQPEHQIEWDHPIPRAILVHELVHHAQCVNHRVGLDPCANEREAYRLEATFLREQEQINPDPRQRELAGMMAALKENLAADCGESNRSLGR